MNIARTTQVLTLAATSLTSVAADVSVELELAVIDTAEYHRPYVAVWLEDDQRKQAAQLELWLEQEKWHRDLRSWWRRGGRRLELPIDGVSGATRKPGRYKVNHDIKLKPGSYTLNVEAVREVGGREHVRIPFTWQGEALTFSRRGESELGAINFHIRQE